MASITERLMSVGTLWGMKLTYDARFRGEIVVKSFPSYCTDPSACSKPAMARSSVDLPAALGPVRTVTSTLANGGRVGPAITFFLGQPAWMSPICRVAMESTRKDA